MKPTSQQSLTYEAGQTECESEKHDIKAGGQSTFEASSDTKGEEKLPTSSDTDQENDIYAPNPFQGDGRKRDAKRHKN